MDANLQGAFALLGVTPNAPDADLRRAYRRKAMQLHPDRNPSAHAQEEFVRLQAAYELVLATRQAPKRTNAASNTDANRDRRQQEMARRREAARKKREAYERSDAFKMHMALDVLAFHLSFILSVFVFTGLPLIGLWQFGVPGLFGCGVIMLISTPMTIPSLRSYRLLKWLSFAEALKKISRTNEFVITACMLFNLLVLARVGLQTLIPIKLLLLINVFAIVVGYGMPHWVLKRFAKKTSPIAFGWAPALVQVYFLLNFLFSGSPQEKRFYFVVEDSVWGKQTGYPVSIRLQNDAYSAFSGLRFFWDDLQVVQKEQVVYTFEQGLLGWPVMIAYRFE